MKNNIVNTYSLTPSNGVQMKFKNGGYWYKVDALGYEGASEFLASKIMECSNIPKFASYEMEEIRYGKWIFNGCKSKDFLMENENIFTLQKFIRLYTGMTTAAFFKNLSTKGRIERTVDLIEKKTGLPDFGGYLTMLLELDAFTMNEDRHTGNITLLRRDDGTWDYCPVFDNGAAFFSDTKYDYDLELSPSACMNKVKSKPFSSDFVKQMTAAEELFGKQLKLAPFTMDVVKDAVKEIEAVYGKEISMRMYMTAARRFDFIKEFNMIGKAEDFRMPDKQKEATND